MSRALAWLAAAALAAGCAQLGPRPAGGAVEFELAGRLGARYGGESFTANIAWRHAPHADEMLITTPLGQGVARIVRRGDAVTLTTAEPREYHAPDAEALTEQVLGFRLPLAGLADWVRGRPSTASPAVARYDEEGALKQLQEHGWRIDYLKYADGRPSLLHLAYPGVELRLAVSRWN